MSRPNKLSPAQIEEAFRLRERGLSCAKIGARLNVSGTSIEYHCMRHGVEPQGPRVYYRKGQPVRAFTAADDARLLAMASTISNRSEIARLLGRRPGTVTNRLHILANREERAEEHHDLDR